MRNLINPNDIKTLSVKATFQLHTVMPVKLPMGEAESPRQMHFWVTLQCSFSLHKDKGNLQSICEC